ncbi:MAG: DUF4397 domain-containing protein [Steroidobacteraceae bacterium]
MKNTMRNAAILATALLLAACGGGGGGGGSDGSGSSSTYPRLRLANATAGSSLVLNAAGLTDTDVTFTSGTVAAGAASAYQQKKTQSYTVGVSATDGSLIGSTQTLAMSADTDYTLLAYARAGSVSTYTLYDDATTPASGFSTLAIANAAGDAGTLDVYLVSPGGALNGLSPAYSTLYGKTTSSGKTLTAGTYDIVVTASGKPADVRLTVPSVALASGEASTLALTSTPGGGLVDGALVRQGGTISTYPTTKARVRLVGAFPAGPSSNSIVRATIGSTALPAVTAPSVGVYTLVTANTSSWSVTVDGVAVADLPAAEFEYGGDYTVLAYGDPASPRVAVFTDSNLPSTSGAAYLRTVNAAVSGGGLTLTDDYVPINVDVQYGTASTYSPATASTSSVVEVSSPVAAFPTYTVSDFNIASSGVYTVFVLGSTSAPVVSFARDR